MRFAVPQEPKGERRVALVPSSVKTLLESGFSVAVQPGAGVDAGFSDQDYEEAGASIEEEPWRGADFLASLRAPAPEWLGLLNPGAVVVGLFSPAMEPDLAVGAAEAGVSLFSLELLPRITRAQSMDALSSQATVTGYWGTLVAATRLPRFFPMLMTAAGTIPPARVLVIGAGVAGLQAIATARRLGAAVVGHDVRPVSQTEVESLGAKFLSLEAGDVTEGSGGYAASQPAEVQRRQREVLAPAIENSDVVITTAAIPGRRAPVIVTSEMVQSMRTGSVVVDLAADTGGNCELTQVGKEVRVPGGAVVIGVRNPPGGMPMHASQLYSRNIVTFAQAVLSEGKISLDLTDEVLEASCVVYGGEIRHQPTADRVGLAGA